MSPIAETLLIFAAHPGDRFERAAVDFFKRVREVFRQRAQQNDRVQEVDATGPRDAVEARIEAVLLDFLVPCQG